MVDMDSGRFRENLARGGNFLVLTFTKSKTQISGIEGRTNVRIKSREHWFFKVEAARELKRRPYNAGLAVAAFKSEAEGVEDPYLEPEEGISAVPLVDRNGNDILRNDDDHWFVYHLGVSPLQGEVRVYPQIPDSQPGGVFQYLGSNRPNAIAGDPVGYISGDDHPSWYDPETGFSTTLAWDTGVNTDIRYQFYNEHKTRRTIPKLNIFGAGYVLSPILDKNVQRNLLHGVTQNDPAIAHVEYGPIRETFSYELPDEWDSTGNYIEETSPSIPPEYKVPAGRPNSLPSFNQDLGGSVGDSEESVLSGINTEDMSDRQIGRAVRQNMEANNGGY
ncbi:MAG: hypothetical protein J07AB43_01520 [Candidatus Nanosalina sp. J07AB43]|jgi:hypothetical protein|nr:MAG: hypothetical protein J07AB43_01520 [Candidatus Nanosalina sp. J07AB43]